MASVTYLPPNAKAGVLDVTVGECVYTFMPGVPQFVPPEHIAKVRTAIANANGVLAATPTPAAAVIGTGGAATWTYRIVPVNAAGIDSAQSASGTTGAAGNATLTAGVNFNRITWTAVVDAQSYKVIRQTSGGTPASTGVIGTTSALTFDDPANVASAYVAATGDALGGSPTPTAAVVGAGGAATWTYRIVPYNASGFDGAQSASGTTGAAQAATLTAANYTHVSWTAVSNAAGYKVIRQTSGGTPASTGVIANVDKSVLAFDDIGPAAVAYVAVTQPDFGTILGPPEI